MTSTTSHQNEFVSLKSAAPIAADTTSLQYDFINDIDFEDLDLTNTDLHQMDFSRVEANLNTFQEDKIVSNALEQNINLTNYGKKIERDLKNIEIASIKDCIQSSEDLVDLHNQIHSADALLESMENIVSGFQDHLQQKSREIKQLQDKILLINTELQNTKDTVMEFNKYEDVFKNMLFKMQFHSPYN